MNEIFMLSAVDKLPLPKLVNGHLVIAISPTRGIQLARVEYDEYLQRQALKRIGGPVGILEEQPDFLHDAKPFMLVEFTLEQIRGLRNDLATARQERDEALRVVESLRAKLGAARTH